MIDNKKNQNSDDFIDYIVQKYAKKNNIEPAVFRGEVSWTVLRSGVVDFLEFLRDDVRCRFTRLLDVTAVDNMTDSNRFSVVYHLQSLFLGRTVRVRTVTEKDIPVASVTGIFPVAGWYEREMWDMFGIVFSGHDDLRCLLTDDSFKGEPLCKDFPTCGEKRLRYDAVGGQFYYDSFVEKAPENKAKITELG